MTFKASGKRAAEIDAASKDEEHLMENITHPGLHDCLGGRGGHATNHPGNVKFRSLVSQYKDHYMGLSRYGKLQVAAEVVNKWRSQDPPGRFLAMTDPSNRDNTTWYDIGDKEALKKTSQCLRERIPPHQKQRTLAMVCKKDKTSRRSNLEQDDSSRSVTDSERSVLREAHNIISRQIMTRDDFQPRPILEPATVSIASSSPTPSENGKCVAVEVEAPVEQPNGEVLLQLDGEGNCQPQQTFIPFPEPTPVPNFENLQREASSCSGIGSWPSSEDTFWMHELLEDSDSQGFDGNKSTPEPKDGMEIEANVVDAGLIPSAANLTRDVFDEDIYKPLRAGSADWKTFADSRRDSCSMLPTSLNRAFSSHYTSIFGR